MGRIANNMSEFKENVKEYCVMTKLYLCHVRSIILLMIMSFFYSEPTRGFWGNGCSSGNVDF